MTLYEKYEKLLYNFRKLVRIAELQKEMLREQQRRLKNLIKYSNKLCDSHDNLEWQRDDLIEQKINPAISRN